VVAAPTDICTIDKAKEIEEGNGRNDIEIDLQPKPGFGSPVKLHERLTVPEQP
jgi:hypothetical protein